MTDPRPIGERETIPCPPPPCPGCLRPPSTHPPRDDDADVYEIPVEVDDPG